MEFLNIFLYFLQFFELFFWKFRKNSENFLPLPQQNFAIQLSKVGFFHQPVTYFVRWKNPKTTKKCFVLPVEAAEVFSPEIQFSADMGFRLITLSQCIQIAPNASEMIEYHPFWVRTDSGYFKT